MKKNQPVSLEQIGRQLKDKRGKRYWRTLEELAESEAFQELVENEFPESPFDWKNAFSRRKFLQLMGASMAFAGLTACTRQPLERIIPYVKPPEEIIPGKPLYFATANTMRGYAVGVLVESHMGRPTKIEGNPDHPASLGASDIFAQASILDLYDPDRSRVVKYLGRIGAWEDFLSAMRTELEAQKLNDGAGVRILTETVTSPTLHRQLQAFLSAFPLAKWHQYEPAHTDNTKAGAQLAFGQFVDTRYDFENADVILSLDADFLMNHPASLPYARQFSARRRPEAAGHMNRLYVAESTPTLTGSMADHRWPLRASELPALAFKVADALGAVAAQNLSLEAPLDALDFDDNRVRAIAEDLQRHAGRCLVVAGEAQPPEVHLLAHAMNFALGNVGKTVFYTDPVEANPVLHGNSLRELVEEMQAGSVDLLVMLG
ncbi:MAG: molybdopterin oxidoreductase, partial [Calditrichaeota bacterium]